MLAHIRTFDLLMIHLRSKGYEIDRRSMNNRLRYSPFTSQTLLTLHLAMHSVASSGWFVVFILDEISFIHPRMSCYIFVLQTFDTLRLFDSIFGFQGTKE